MLFSLLNFKFLFIPSFQAHLHLLFRLSPLNLKNNQNFYQSSRLAGLLALDDKLFPAHSQQFTTKTVLDFQYLGQATTLRVSLVSLLCYPVRRGVLKDLAMIIACLDQTKDISA